MLSLHPIRQACCSGVSRRELLQVGAATAAGLSLPDALRGRAAAAAAPDVNCIFFFLWGGPSQHETFDPKPEAPPEIRGPFAPIPTAVAGLQFCEHLPRLAKLAGRFTTIRCLHHGNDLHHLAAGMALSGQLAQQGLRPPNHGAVVERFGPRAGSALPPSVRIGPYLLDCAGDGQGQDGGFLGGAYSPFAISDPREPLEKLASLVTPPQVGGGRMSRRRSLLGRVDAIQRRVEGGDTRTRDAAYSKAFALITSPQAKRALDLGQEPEWIRERYGDSLPGRGLLMARRLVEAGARYVQVNWSQYVAMTGWDTHGTGENMGGTIPQMKEFLLPTLDRVASTLFEDLEQRGLDRNTVVVVAGEFGRTPRINKIGGRDHWPAVYPALLYGAGVPRGVVIGGSDGEGAYPEGERCTPEDLALTLYQLLGLDVAPLRAAEIVRAAAGIPGLIPAAGAPPRPPG